MKNFGRHRQSIVDIEQELNDIFREHPQCHTDAAGAPSLPARCLSDVFDTYKEEYGVELLARDEKATFMQIVDESPGLEVTPDIILQLVAMRTSSGQQNNSEEHSPITDEWNRGRADERDTHGQHSRSSSNGSTGTYYRPTPGGTPRTPGSKDSPFDAQKRQRSAPLAPVAPSSWTRRPPAPGRRKSDASNNGRPMSDTEPPRGYNARGMGRNSIPNYTAWFRISPTVFGRPTGGRSRAPSNPISPTTSHGSMSSPPLGAVGSRPHSRAHSNPQTAFPFVSSPQPDLASAMYDAFEKTVSSLPMPRMSDSDSDDSDDDSSLGLVLDRSTTSSTASMEPLERLEALQRINADLGKKLVEAERTLQRKLSDHESELEEMEARLEEAKSELSAAKREEKELRNKERSNQTQIAALESEIAKVQKTLDNSRSMYNSLQKQYQEQLHESEDLRNTLRRKDEEIRNCRESLSLQQMETSKYLKENEAYEERIVLLEQDLALAQQAQTSLDEQKQENLMLKETIDRMRFDMDELRATLAPSAGSGTSSAPGSVSRSLGAELLSKMKNDSGWIDDEDEADAAATLKELGIDDPDENTDDEDIVQTIITRKKKRGLSKANKIEAFTLEDSREFADAYTQYDPKLFAKTSTTQTDPPPKILTTSFGAQTDMSTNSISTQTDTPTLRVTMEAEIQTEETAVSRSPSPQEDDEALASSSSTVLPPTPKAKPTSLDLLAANSPTDLPPSYNQRRDLRIAVETLRSWHNGLKLPLRQCVDVSAETLEEWRALKAEVGIGCKVIDRALEDAVTNSTPTSRRQKSNRFYNIYNTYVYGGNSVAGRLPPWSGLASHALFCVGASAVVFFAMSPFMPHQYVVPGGPTYYDRAAWSSFNTMHATGEGFPGEGTTAVWNFLGRVGGGAARIARGWPT
ncbi:hypothetical protein BJY52DRAFT_1427326 [Lactarius psammicola]|nr:hypothetical protein BJY52DRAFT_1427326 [Lactarius psammicola]